MKEEFSIVVGDHHYLLKRIEYGDLLSYHVHHKTNVGHVVFRIRKTKNSWMIYPQKLPKHVQQDEPQLFEAIISNESSD